ncbi:MAG: hypothetical protein AAFQ76_09945 [Cyanobacteria bacterium J06626_26]
MIYGDRTSMDGIDRDMRVRSHLQTPAPERTRHGVCNDWGCTR